MPRCAFAIGSQTTKWLNGSHRFLNSSSRPSNPPIYTQRILELASKWKPSPLKSTSDPTGEPAGSNSEMLTSTSNPQTPWASDEEEHPLYVPPLAEPEITAWKPTSFKPHVGESPEPYQRRPLPASPLMDPETIAAKNKYHEKKASPSKTPESMQQQLAKNPYALALATPLRKCQLTKINLPRYFLQDFTLMSHPVTKEPWFAPRSLTAKYGNPDPWEQKDLEPEDKERLDLGDAIQAQSELQANTPTLGIASYTIANLNIIQSMQEKEGYLRTKSSRAARYNGSRFPNEIHTRFMSERVYRVPALMKIYEQSGWRQDMADSVLELMRRRMVEALTHVVKMKGIYLVGCHSWDDALAKKQFGAYLWTGGKDLVEGNASPSEFATLDITRKATDGAPKTQKIPVHNLRTLLGDEKLNKLRATFPSGIFEREVIAIKRKRMTVDLQMRLWKLQGYLAQFRDYDHDGEPRQDEDQGEDGEGEEEDPEERGQGHEEEEVSYR